MAFLSAAAFAQDNGGQPKDLATIAAESADYLQEVLRLDDRQVYRVDSTYLYNYTRMTDEMNGLKKAGVSAEEQYQSISDRWMNACDTTFIKMFSDEQWAKYLKTRYGREKKARDKRIQARAKM